MCWDGYAIFFKLEQRISLDKCLSKHQMLGVHVIYRHGIHYPINHLRNMAIENARTTYNLILDIDFLPMIGLYEYLNHCIQLLFTSVVCVLTLQMLLLGNFCFNNYPALVRLFLSTCFVIFLLSRLTQASIYHLIISIGSKNCLCSTSV